MNVSQQTIGSWEVGRTEPSNENLNALCNIFNTSIDYLLGITDIKIYDDAEEEFQRLLKDPELFLAFKDLMNLSESDKQEIINYKILKNNNKI